VLSGITLLARRSLRVNIMNPDYPFYPTLPGQAPMYPYQAQNYQNNQYGAYYPVYSSYSATGYGPAMGDYPAYPSDSATGYGPAMGNYPTYPSYSATGYGPAMGNSQVPYVPYFPPSPYQYQTYNSPPWQQFFRGSTRIPHTPFAIGSTAYRWVEDWSVPGGWVRERWVFVRFDPRLNTPIYDWTPDWAPYGFAWGGWRTYPGGFSTGFGGGVGYDSPPGGIRSWIPGLWEQGPVPGSDPNQPVPPWGFRRQQ
jgi:hypothetical protein